MSTKTSGPTTASQPPSEVGFTAVDVARKALELAEANPDFVYQGDDCVYVEDGKGSCLFGQALMSLGYAVSKDQEGTDVSGLLGDLGLSGPFHFLNIAQFEQDGQEPWGSEAVAGNLRTFLREAE